MMNALKLAETPPTRTLSANHPVATVNRAASSDQVTASRIKHANSVGAYEAPTLRRFDRPTTLELTAPAAGGGERSSNDGMLWEESQNSVHSQLAISANNGRTLSGQRLQQQQQQQQQQQPRQIGFVGLAVGKGAAGEEHHPAPPDRSTTAPHNDSITSEEPPADRSPPRTPPYSSLRVRSMALMRNDDDTIDTGSTTSGTSELTDQAKASRGAGVSTFRCAGIKLRVPFTVWTFFAMLIPIGILIAVTSVTLHETVQELNVINDHFDVTNAIGQCAGYVMQERDTLGRWLTRGTVSVFTRLQAIRDNVQQACFETLTAELTRLAAREGEPGGSMAAAQRAHQVFLRKLDVVRVGVDARTTDGRETREFFTAAIASMARPVVWIANRLQENARAVAEIKLLIETRNFLALARGVGLTVAFLPITNTSTKAVQEYIAAHAQATLSTSTLLDQADTGLEARVQRWVSSPEAETMWELLDRMADVDNDGVGDVQRNNASNWWPVVTAGIDAVQVIEREHLETIRKATRAKRAVRDAALFMGFGVSVCLAAAGLLAWTQSRVRRQLETQVQAVERTRQAVSAFVPRFFLHKMGYTSITQVRVGESTNVALAMLFSDIRHFTTVAEGMSNTELFEWVQGYFQRMTSIVESRRGNVNEFIGDALFAVFSTCADSIYCAIDMQADVQQLNVQRLCENEAIIPIEVGVGIHHDVVAMGILGDESRHTCTTISASVNLASRLEGLTKQLGCSIIASQAVISQLTASEADRLRHRRLGAVQVKGSNAGVIVYDIFQTDPRDLQLYKVNCRTEFERVTKAALDGSAPVAIEALRTKLAPLVNDSDSLPASPAARTQSLVAPASPPALSPQTVPKDGPHPTAPRSPAPNVIAGATDENVAREREAEISDSAKALLAGLAEHGVRDRPLEIILSMRHQGKLRFDSK